MSAKGTTEITLEERKFIQTMIQKGHSYNHIGNLVGRRGFSVGQEVRRYGGREDYDAFKAHREAMRRKEARFDHLVKKFTDEEAEHIRICLGKGYSIWKISRELQCDKFTIERYLRRHKPEPIKSKDYYTLEDRVAALEEQIKILYDEVTKGKENA